MPYLMADLRRAVEAVRLAARLEPHCVNVEMVQEAIDKLEWSKRQAEMYQERMSHAAE